jgi:ABC-2 type transport system ATP-binding protein
MTQYAFDLENLSWQYAGATRKSLDNVSLRIPKSTFFALLGPNGAGKTTLFSVLSGLHKTQTGSIKLFDEAASTSLLHEHIGIVPQEIALYEQLNAEENLYFFGRLRGLTGQKLRSTVAQSLERMRLTPYLDRPVRNFSGGMKRRLNLAVVLLHHYPVLLLDEPTVGVDPQSRHLIYDVLKELHQSGTTIVYSTHYMEEVTRLCSHVAIMDHGKILYDRDTIAGQDVEALFLSLTGRNLKDG